jgi:hypothetical protein
MQQFFCPDARTSVVALVVEGGKTALDQLYETVLQGIQVLVCEGTGRLADLIATGCRLSHHDE